MRTARPIAARGLVDREGLSVPTLPARVAEANAQIQIDIAVTDEEFAIIAEGYHAGVRLAT